MNDVLITLFDLDGGLTLLPAIVAVFMALVTQRVVPSLAVGVALGGVIAAEGAPQDALRRTLSYCVDAVWDRDHVIVSLFSLIVAATVGVMGRSGGTRALITRVEGVAKGRRGAMVASWLSGAIVFFDDYANCLVVGSAMAPLYDRYKVSRAKLAYIVDSTAAPVASLALVSTWVGYEVGLIAEALTTAGSDVSAFSFFVDSLPYRFYSIFTLAFVGAIALSGRDFGPMREEELRARKASSRQELDEDDTSSTRGATSPWLAALPVMVLVGGTGGYLYWDGWVKLGEKAASARLFEILGEADPYLAMLVGATAGYGLAVGMALGSGALALKGVGKASYSAARSVAVALSVLYLAWALGNAMDDTGAATYTASLLDGRLPASLLPTAVFILAAGTAFSIGSSFVTMGILIPLAIPLAIGMTGGELTPVVYGSTAAVLAGACLGDHTSPISDTTVLSALGSGVDVVTHVRTQMPYAIATGLIAIVLGYLPAGLDVSPLYCIPLGMLACVLVVFVVGRPLPAEAS